MKNFTWELLFKQYEPKPFNEIPIGTTFLIPNTLETNRYWKTAQNDWLPCQSPIICLKKGEDIIEELMKDYPQPSGKVPPKNVGMIVIPVEFNG